MKSSNAEIEKEEDRKILLSLLENERNMLLRTLDLIEKNKAHSPDLIFNAAKDRSIITKYFKDALNEKNSLEKLLDFYIDQRTFDDQLQPIKNELLAVPSGKWDLRLNEAKLSFFLISDQMNSNSKKAEALYEKYESIKQNKLQGHFSTLILAAIDKLEKIDRPEAKELVIRLSEVKSMESVYSELNSARVKAEKGDSRFLDAISVIRRDVDKYCKNEDRSGLSKDQQKEIQAFANKDYKEQMTAKIKQKEVENKIRKADSSENSQDSGKENKRKSKK